MAGTGVKARAVIFDVYGTLIDAGEAPPDAESRWHRLFQDFFHSLPPMDRAAFAGRAGQVIARHHAEARACGIAWPEVLWPSVMTEVLPSLAELPAGPLADFIYEQMQITRAIRLLPGAAECLRRFQQDRVLLGIASNAQAYTLRELEGCLKGAGLDLSVFAPELCFWSFEHGFSKPNPHVFRILSTRLAARGIRPADTLMVGDRQDNDILPALAQGWQSWHRCSPVAPGVPGGDLWHLLEWWSSPE